MYGGLEGSRGDDDEVRRSACGIGLSAANEEGDMPCFLLELGGDVLESGDDGWSQGFGVEVEVGGERRGDHVGGDAPGGVGDVDACWTRQTDGDHDVRMDIL